MTRRVTNREIEICRDWASSRKEIRHMYLHGSRVSGQPRSDSDLDVMIRAVPAAAVMLEKNEWEAELSKRLGIRVEMHNYNDAHPDHIAAALQGIAAYNRNGEPIDFVSDDDFMDVDP